MRRTGGAWSRTAGAAARRTRGIQILRRAIAEAEEEYADDTRLEASLGEAVELAGELATHLSRREHELLAEMGRWADRARSRPDSKADALLAWLEQCVRPDGQWTDGRVIVFTEYRATLNYLIEVLTSRGYGDPERLATMYGGMDEDNASKSRPPSRPSPRESSVRILVATDAASEGIDLQNHCNLMIHAEIRGTQTASSSGTGGSIATARGEREVLIHHFVGAGYGSLSDEVDLAVGELEADLEFLMRAVRKVDRIREDLGSVGPVDRRAGRGGDARAATSP